MKVDAVVLGAGIVGISVALHLQKRGRLVALVDRRGAAEETSFGNAGLIQREGVYPYGFPHDFGALFRYGLNRTIDAHYHPTALLKLAPFLCKYWHHSRRKRHAQIARLYARLIEHCVTEHDALAREAGLAVTPPALEAVRGVLSGAAAALDPASDAAVATLPRVWIAAALAFARAIAAEQTAGEVAQDIA